jgi:hypothetical protein
MLVTDVMGSAPLAHAEPINPMLGKLDGVFFKERINTTVKKNHSIKFPVSEYSTPPGELMLLVGENKKFDSGNGNCVAGLVFMRIDIGTTQHQGLYALISVCKLGVTNTYALADITPLRGGVDGSAGEYMETITLPPEGATKGFWWTDNTDQIYAQYYGTIVIKTTFKANYSLKSAKLVQPADGTVLVADESIDEYGTAKSGLSLKQVAADKVDESAKACIEDAAKYWLNTGTPSIAGCGVDFTD